MDEKRFDRDELARRRALRARRTQGGAQPQDLDEDEDAPPPKFSWGETFAMIVAAYQVLLPPVLAIVGVMGLVWLLFRYVF